MPLIVISADTSGRAVALMVGRRERCKEAWGGQPLPTDEAGIRELARKAGASVGTALNSGG